MLAVEVEVVHAQTQHRTCIPLYGRLSPRSVPIGDVYPQYPAIAASPMNPTPTFEDANKAIAAAIAMSEG